MRAAEQGTFEFEAPGPRPRRKLMQGDCLEVLPTLPDECVDMVFADLPYGVTANKWDTPIDLSALWAQLRRVGTRRCAFVFTATQPFTSALVYSQIMLFKSEIIWDKGVAGNFTQATFRPMRVHENILIFSCGGAAHGARMMMTYNPQMTPSEKICRPHAIRVKSDSAPVRGRRQDDYVNNKVYTHKHPRSVLPISLRADKARGLHPTQKPIALLDWLIRTYSNSGDTVLDPTMGSGTAGVSAKLNGRHFIGIEKDATYFDIAKRRIADA